MTASTTVTASPSVGFGAAETRMLLASDGSTTLLLQALLGEPLQVEVERQHHVAARALPGPARAALAPGPAAELLVRTSLLRTARGRIVSRNLVVADLERAGALGGPLQDRGTPLGHGLIALGLSQSRRLLASGRDRWDGDGGPPCAYKAYVLSAGSAPPCVYIHERFNPAFVPVVTDEPSADRLDTPSTETERLR